MQTFSHSQKEIRQIQQHEEGYHLVRILSVLQKNLTIMFSLLP